MTLKDKKVVANYMGWFSHPKATQWDDFVYFANGRQGHWEHIDRGFVRRVAILGGFNGDDAVGTELIYYPKNGSPEKVQL
jgi:hypothetical protein